MADRSASSSAITADDRILPFTRIVAWLVIPFLVAAFIILYLDGTRTAEWFSWEIPSRLTTALMGAGYLGGAYFFLRVGLGAGQRHIHLGAGYLHDSSYISRWRALRWHEVHLGYPAVTTFTIFMLLATLLHWDKFFTNNWPFWVWLVLYIVTPILVPAVWWLNRPADPHTPAPGDRIVPAWLRFGVAALGGFFLAISLAAFFRPQFIIDIWPWTLSPLTARVMAGWHALLGVGLLAMASDRRWSAWPVPMQSIAIWYVLLLGAFVWHQEEFGAGLLNWYSFLLIGSLAGMLVISLIMRGQPRLAER
ncbi:MAG: hypothetical protein ACK2UK_09960 [Candidatus Promineifilaceae bacterium]|jgi:hypothetical protein